MLRGIPHCFPNFVATRGAIQIHSRGMLNILVSGEKTPAIALSSIIELSVSCSGGDDSHAVYFREKARTQVVEFDVAEGGLGLAM